MADVKLSQNEYAKIQWQLAKLDALENGGVDNWEWYSESLKEWFAENELDEAFDIAIADIEEVLCSADVDEPAGSGAGYSIHFDEIEMKKVLAALIANAINIDKKKRETV